LLKIKTYYTVILRRNRKINPEEVTNNKLKKIGIGKKLIYTK